MNIDNTRQFKNKTILVIGDVMVDKYIRGRINRISPEAPVPIVEVDNETLSLGGAANVMHNLVTLGAKVSAMCVIGQDYNGSWLTSNLRKLGISTDRVVVDDKRPTTTKTRIIAGHNHIVRYDQESTNEIGNDMTKKLVDDLYESDEIDGIIISDYDKGLMTSALIKAIIKFAKINDKGIVVDPKLRHHMEYKNVDIIKTNIGNASSAMGIFSSQDNIDKKLCTSILKRLHCKSVVITKGKEGMSILDGERFIKLPSLAKEVYDVTGAGDVVSAVLGLSYFSGFSIEESAILSTLAASVKVGKLGTHAVSIDEIKKITKIYKGDLSCISTTY